MEKPSHLAPPESPRTVGGWIAKRPAAVLAFALGMISFVIVVAGTGDVWATPDWRLSVPGFAATAIASLLSLVRRERALLLWGIGLAVAGGALILGYVLLVALIAAAAAAIILILHAIM